MILNNSEKFINMHATANFGAILSIKLLYNKADV